jgi:hypothetical protein
MTEEIREIITKRFLTLATTRFLLPEKNILDFINEIDGTPVLRRRVLGSKQEKLTQASLF